MLFPAPPLRARPLGRRLQHALLTGLLLCLCLAAVPRARADDARSSPDRHADLAFDRYEHDFGQAAQMATLTTRFTYTNKGSQTVSGIKVRGECGCTRMDLSHESLEPAESGTLEVEFQTGTLAGFLRKRLHISSSDYTRGSAIIPLRVAIVKGLLVSAGGVSFRDVPLGTKPTKAFHLNWYEGAGTPFEVESVSVPGFDFETRIVPYKTRKDPLWKGWTVEVTFRETPPLGMFSAEVRVRTTDKERPELSLPLSANIHGKIYVQSRYLSFGSFVEGEAKTVSMKFRPYDKSISFGEVTAKSRSGALQVEVKPDPQHAEAGFWRLYATVPADRAPGSLEQEVIELHTGVPGEELTLLTVRGSVKAAKKKPAEDETR